MKKTSFYQASVILREARFLRGGPPGSQGGDKATRYHGLRTTPMQIPGYEIIRRIGAGGMGIVYEAKAILTERLEALKIIHPQLFCDEETRKRFLREIRFMATCSHPNIVTLYSAGTLTDTLYYTMELLPGPSL